MRRTRRVVKTNNYAESSSSDDDDEDKPKKKTPCLEKLAGASDPKKSKQLDFSDDDDFVELPKKIVKKDASGEEKKETPVSKKGKALTIKQPTNGGDSSSSESDIENYLKRPEELNLNSTFFKSDKPTQTPTFSQIEKNIFEDVKQLSDSDSESEFEDADGGVEKEESVAVEKEVPRATFQQLNEFTKKIEEAKMHVEKYKAMKKVENKKDDISELLMIGEKNVWDSPEMIKGANSGLNDRSLRSSEFESFSESEKEDWEEVEQSEQQAKPDIIPKNGVEITVEMPDTIRKKKSVDLLAIMKRRLNRIRKENQVYVHRVHLLCWVAHGNYVNNVLNKESLLAVALSLLPSQQCYPSDRTDLKYLEGILGWYRRTITIVEKKTPKNMELDKNLMVQFNKKQACNSKMFVYMFVCILRALGIQCRLVMSLQVEPLRPPASELHSLSAKSNEGEEKSTKKNEVSKGKTNVGKAKTKSEVGKRENKIAGNVKKTDTELGNIEKNRSSGRKRKSVEKIEEPKGKISKESIDTKKSNKNGISNKDKLKKSNNSKTSEKCDNLDKTNKKNNMKINENDAQVVKFYDSSQTSSTSSEVEAIIGYKKQVKVVVHRLDENIEEESNTNINIKQAKTKSNNKKRNKKESDDNLDKIEIDKKKSTRATRQNTTSTNRALNNKSNDSTGSGMVLHYPLSKVDEDLNDRIAKLENLEKVEITTSYCRKKVVSKRAKQTTEKNNKVTENVKEKEEKSLDVPENVESITKKGVRTVQDLRAAKTTQRPAVSRAAETTGTSKDSGVTETSQASEVSRAAETTRASNDSGVTEISQASEASGATETTQASEVSRAAETTRASKDSGVTKTSQASEGSGATETTQASEVSRAAEITQATKDSGVTETTRASEVSTATVTTLKVPAIIDDLDMSRDSWRRSKSLSPVGMQRQVKNEPAKSLNKCASSTNLADEEINEESKKEVKKRNGRKRIYKIPIKQKSKPVVVSQIDGVTNYSSEEYFSDESDCSEFKIPQLDGNDDEAAGPSSSKQPSLHKLRESRSQNRKKPLRLNIQPVSKDADAGDDFSPRSPFTPKNSNFPKINLTCLKDIQVKSGIEEKMNAAKGFQINTSNPNIKLERLKNTSKLQKLKSNESSDKVNLEISNPTVKLEKLKNPSKEKLQNLKGNDSSSRNKVNLAKLSPKKTIDVRNDIVSLVKDRIKEQNFKDKSKLVKNKRKLEEDSDSDFAPMPVVKKKQSPKESKVKVKRRIPPKSVLESKIFSSDDEATSSTGKSKKKGVDIWVEVFLENEEKWISADVIKGQVHCVKEIYARATHPISYILSWDNINRVKDVTKRYCTNWNTTTRKLRTDEKWWEQSLAPFIGKKNARDKEEDTDLARQQLDQPLPKSIAEYKDHPLYVLPRHLLKFQAIYPPDAVTLGFIRNEPVYSRDCVYTLHSREIWLKEAKVVKPGEKPYKIVKARPKWDKLSNTVIKDQTLEIFGKWQVEDYVPPTAENGIVPRNAYGNVELFKECMLPKGTVHLQLPGLNKVAKKLQIDCAPAVVGFDFHSGWSHPTFDGFIVCEEFSDKLITAWYQEQEDHEKREQEKYEKRVYGNWRRLIKGLLIRERLKARYDFGGEMTVPIPKPPEKPEGKPKGPRFIINRKKKSS